MFRKSPFIICVLLIVGIVATIPSRVQAQVSVAQRNSRSNEEVKQLLEEGRRLVSSGDFDGAIDVYQRAATIEPRNASIYSGIGFLQARQGKFREALTSYRRAISLNPNSSDFYEAVGFIHGNLGDMKAAKEAYRKSVQLNRRNLNAYLGLGVTQTRLGDYSSAMWAFEQAIGIDRNNGKVYEFMGASFKQRGKKQDASRILQKARDLYQRRNDADGVSRVENLLRELGG